MATTTKGMIYLTALNSLEKLEVQYIPTSFSTNREANLGEVAVVGRNNPKHHYTGGSNGFTLELDFYSDQKNREDVVAKCRLLESWSMNDGNKPQELIRVTFGKFFKENEVFRIASINVDYSLFSTANSMLPRIAKATVEFKLDTKFNRKSEDVKWS